MNTTPPKVSVVIPVYNVEPYLAHCLDSILAQTLPEIEIICVDDGSTDGSLTILDEYCRKDSRIRILKHEKNKGLLQARKDGVMQATGEAILFVDSDDHIESNACEVLYRNMEQTGADIIAFGVIVDGDVGSIRTQLERRYSMHADRLTGREIARSCFIPRTCTHNIWNKFYRAALCKQSYSEIPDQYCTMAEDACAFFILACNATLFVGIEDKLYHYNYGVGVSGSPSTSLARFDRYCDQEGVIQTIQEFLERNGIFQEYIQEFRAIENRLIQYCIDVFFGLKAEEKDAGMNCLVKHWGGQRIADALMRRSGSTPVANTDVVRQFAAGRHGLRCLLNCSRAWLTYKLKRRP